MSKYCRLHEIHYEQPECPNCAVEGWKSQRRGGCLIVFVSWPLWLVGLFLGLFWSAFWSGFKSTRTIWDEVWKAIRAPKPGRRES